MNSEHVLFNMPTTIGEHIKYFRYTYNIAMSDIIHFPILIRKYMFM